MFAICNEITIQNCLSSCFQLFEYCYCQDSTFFGLQKVTALSRSFVWDTSCSGGAKYLGLAALAIANFTECHRATWSLTTFCTITDVFRFSSRIFHLMTSKMNHDDRNGHFACNFFHCEAMISSFAKVTGPQSRLILEKTEDQKCLDSKNVVLGIENVINMTAVVILVIPLIILNIGCL